MAKATKKTEPKEPVKPVKYDGRICFGIAFFTSEEDAQKYDAYVKQRGDSYNGGWFHGMPCGRDTTWDHKDEKLGQLFAVTTR